MTEEKRIYCIVAATIQVPADNQGNTVWTGKYRPLRTVLQPHGRQIAQACHAVSKLRHALNFTPNAVSGPTQPIFIPATTIILQARDSAEMGHIYGMLFKKKLEPVVFSDDNPEYGLGQWPTAVAVFAMKKQVEGILDYLPLWGSA
jgi:hypothetical protein